MQMHTATNVGIKIIGATILRLRASDETGKQVETRQMTYICNSTDRLYLSREACSALGIIPDAFPAVGAHAVDVTVNPNPTPIYGTSIRCPHTAQCSAFTPVIPPPDHQAMVTGSAEVSVGVRPVQPVLVMDVMFVVLVSGLCSLCWPTPNPTGAGQRVHKLEPACTSVVALW